MSAPPEQEERRPETSPRSPSNSAAATKQLNDAIALFRNRVAKLKTEEQRLNAETHSARRQLEKLEAAHETYTARTAQKAAVSNYLKQKREDSQKNTAAQREARKSAIAAARSRSQSQKREAVKEQQRLRQIFECEAQIEKAEMQEHKLTLHSSVRSAELTHRDRWDRIASRKVQSVREQREREMELEAFLRDEKSGDLARLEREERALQERVVEAKRQRDETSHRLREAKGDTTVVLPPITPSAQGSPSNRQPKAADP
jgi:hypothetical protein